MQTHFNKPFTNRSVLESSRLLCSKQKKLIVSCKLCLIPKTLLCGGKNENSQLSATGKHRHRFPGAPASPAGSGEAASSSGTWAERAGARPGHQPRSQALLSRCRWRQGAKSPGSTLTSSGCGLEDILCGPPPPRKHSENLTKFLAGISKIMFQQLTATV